MLAQAQHLELVLGLVPEGKYYYPYCSFLILFMLILAYLLDTKKTPQCAEFLLLSAKLVVIFTDASIELFVL